VIDPAIQKHNELRLIKAKEPKILLIRADVSDAGNTPARRLLTLANEPHKTDQYLILPSLVAFETEKPDQSSGFCFSMGMRFEVCA